MSMTNVKELMTKKRWTRPTEGKHTIVIRDYKFEEHESYDVIILNTTMDDKRDYPIRMFVRDNECTDLNFLCRALISKFGEGFSAIELLDKAINSKLTLDLWVYYNTVVNSDNNTVQEYTNNYWAERNVVSTTTPTAVSTNANSNLPI